MFPRWATAIIEVENGSILLRKPAKAARAGWAEAAAAMSAKTLTAALTTLQEVFAA